MRAHGIFHVLLLTAFALGAWAKHVCFPLELTWETGAPDGNSRQMVYMNGRFPGPPLRLKYGDSVEFTVRNKLPGEVAVHFHGIDQKGTPEYDGVPGLSQKPIQPGESFQYKWHATQYGTYWYHGHVQGLVSDGLYGAIIIDPPSQERKPFDKISGDPKDIAAMRRAELDPYVAIISDWTRFQSEQYYAAEQNSGLDLYCVDSILLNGKGAVNCQPQSLLNEQLNPNLGRLLKQANLTLSDKGCTPMKPAALTQGNFPSDESKVPDGLFSSCEATKGLQEKFRVSASRKWISINFISGASNKAIVASIDEHPMWVYAVDGVYVTPQLVDTVSLNNGERYSVMVKLDQTPGDYTIRMANNLPDQLISGYAMLSYAGGTKTNSTPSINYGGANVSTAVRPFNTAILSPLNQPPPSLSADATYILNMGRFGANWRWSINNESSYTPELNSSSPLLYLTNPASYASSHQSHVIATKNGSWVDLVVVSGLAPSNPAQPPHPIHKHGNKGYVIGGGTGLFKWPSVAEAIKEAPQSFNLVNPPYRDSFVTPAVLREPAWTAFRYHVDNPGAWLLHCHIQTHQNGGQGLAILDGVDAWPYSGDYLGQI